MGGAYTVVSITRLARVRSLSFCRFEFLRSHIQFPRSSPRAAGALALWRRSDEGSGPLTNVWTTRHAPLHATHTFFCSSVHNAAQVGCVRSDACDGELPLSHRRTRRVEDQLETQDSDVCDAQGERCPQKAQCTPSGLAISLMTVARTDRQSVTVDAHRG